LKAQLAEARTLGGARDKIETMSAEVTDENPYSRLMALQRMGIVKNYEDIRKCSVVIVGVGGVGSVAAEMLTRCGIGKLLLYDYDTVELANMNRLFFTPDQAGLSKVDAAAETLLNINPDVNMEAHHCNICTVDEYDKFLERIEHGGIEEGSPVSLVLSCVDNYAARMVVNRACLKLDQAWMESGVAENAVSGHIQMMLPGRTMCFECAPPLIVADGIDEKTLKREGVCAASLPTTMGMTAGMLVQNVLKYLLGFGTVAMYLGYNAMDDYFPTMMLTPSGTCPNYKCLELQKKYEGWDMVSSVMPWKALEAAEAADREVVHEANDWGISCDDDEPAIDWGESAEPAAPGTGVKYAFETNVNEQVAEEDLVQVDADASVEDLQAQMKAMMKN